MVDIDLTEIIEKKITTISLFYKTIICLYS